MVLATCSNENDDIVGCFYKTNLWALITKRNAFIYMMIRSIGIEKVKDMNVITINDLNSIELKDYVSANEKDLLYANYPHEGRFIAESPKVIERAIQAGFEPISMLADQKQMDAEAKGVIQLSLEKNPDMPIYTAEDDVLCQLTGFHLTRGALCLMRRKPLVSASEMLANANKIVILEDVENPTNVGAIFRSAAAFGMDAVLLTKTCANPLYRRAIRVSMGTVFQIPWTYIDEDQWPNAFCDELERREFMTLSMALVEDSLRLTDPLIKQSKKTAFIMGNEGEGLKTETMQRTNHTVYIPMYHGVDSLNVAAASAVAFYELTRSNE